MSTATKKTTKTAAAKPATASVTRTVSKPAAAKPATPKVIDTPQAVLLGPVLRKKELIEKVVARSGIKKKDAKPVIEAMLTELGIALENNREVNLPDFGRIKVRKAKPLPNGRMLIAKIRQVKADKSKPD